MTGVQETFTVEKIEELRKNIDFSDIPELTSMEGFVLKNFKPRKKLISLRIDLDNLAWLQSKGAGYQKKLNDVLRWARANNCPIIPSD